MTERNYKIYYWFGAQQIDTIFWGTTQNNTTLLLKGIRRWCYWKRRAWPSGKALDCGSFIRGFESRRSPINSVRGADVNPLLSLYTLLTHSLREANVYAEYAALPILSTALFVYVVHTLAPLIPHWLLRFPCDSLGESSSARVVHMLSMQTCEISSAGRIALPQKYLW